MARSLVTFGSINVVTIIICISRQLMLEFMLSDEHSLVEHLGLSLFIIAIRVVNLLLEFFQSFLGSTLSPIVIGCFPFVLRAVLWHQIVNEKVKSCFMSPGATHWKTRVDTIREITRWLGDTVSLVHGGRESLSRILSRQGLLEFPDLT